MDIVIINTWLLTFKGDSLGIVKNGAIGVEGNKISYVGPTKGFDYKSSNRIIDGTNHVTMPGLVNAHIHTNSTILRGGAQDMPEIEWMNKGIGPIGIHMTPEDSVVGSKLGVLEGLRTGATTFAEYTGNVSNLVDNTYLPFNARVVATETINEVSRNRGHMKPTDIYEFDREKGEKSFGMAKDLFKKYQNEELVTCMFGPQAIDMISLELLKEIKTEAENLQTRVHMHVAQGQREQLQIEGRYGKDTSTVKILAKNDLLSDTLIAAHCHGSEPSERELMVKQGVNMVGCPSCISLIDGIVPPIGHYHSLGGNVGIGSDQAPGPGVHNMFTEMRTISLVTKTMLKDPTALPAWEVLKIGTKGGATILGLEDKIGSLEEGKLADIITVDLKRPNLTPVVSKPFHNFVPNLVYSATGYEVDNVIINGKEIILSNEFVSINQEEIIKEANKSAQRVFADAEEDWIKAGSQLVSSVKKGLL
ncbi:MAG: amidohydrolase family protein [Candidatus Heimdallarchaeota archaeon]